MENINTIDDRIEKLSYNIAIVGGGQTCRAFLNMLKNESPNYLDIHVTGICDTNAKAEGLATAREMGIPTMNKCSDIFKTKKIDAILELTNNEALSEIMKHKPPDVIVIEHNAGRLLRTFFSVSRKLASVQNQINLEKRSYDILFQQSNIGIVVLNPNFTIVDANSAYLQAVKKNKDEAVGKPCHEIVKKFFAPCLFSQVGFECPVARTLKTGKSSIAIHEHTVSEGQTSYYKIETYPIKDKNGIIVRIIELWREITKELSLQLDKRVRRMETDMKRKIQEDRMISLGRLAASCVHEINNPIQGLLTFTDLMQTILQEGNPSEEDIKDFKKYTNIMSRELERCGQIISGLLSFSRESSIEYKQVNLNDIIHSVVSLTRHKMELRNIDLNIRLSHEELNVLGDINQLQQCFLNLIFNAIEAMPEGGEICVISGLDGKDRSRIEIRDTGYGIPKDDLVHIFDPFFTTKENGKGIGLGLSITYGMIKSHKGNIEAESQEGKGTVFVLTFPRL